MNPMVKHHLKYAKQWYLLSVCGSKNVDAFFCEHHMWQCLLDWAMCKDEG